MAPVRTAPVQTLKSLRPDDLRGEGMKRAYRAARRMQEMTPMLSGVLRAMTGNPKTEVRMTNGTPCTDGRVVWLRPPLELGDEIKHDRTNCAKRDANSQPVCPACWQMERVHSTFFHEMAHIVFQTMQPIDPLDQAQLMTRVALENPGLQGSRLAKIQALVKRAFADNRTNYMGIAQVVSPFLPTLINVLEDARVNRRMYEVRSGTFHMFRAKIIDVMKNGVMGLDGTKFEWTKEDENGQAMIGILTILSGVEPQDGWLSDAVITALRDNDLRGELDQFDLSTSTAADVYRLSFKVLEHLRRLGFCRRKDDPQDDENDEPQDNPPSSPQELDSNQEDESDVGNESDGGDSSSDEPVDSDDDTDADDGDSDLDPGEPDDDDDDDDDESSANDEDQADETDSDSESETGTESETGSEPSEGNDGESLAGDQPETSDETDQDSAGDSGTDGEALQRSVPDSPEPGDPDDEADADAEAELDDEDDNSQAFDANADESDGDEAATQTEPDGDESETGSPDDSQGSNEVDEEAADERMEHSDPDTVAKLVQIFGGHDPDINQVDPTTERQLGVAIIQAEQFDEPSSTVTKFEVHHYNKPTERSMALSWHAQRDSSYERDPSRFEVPETLVGRSLMALRRIFADNKKARQSGALRHGNIIPSKLPTVMEGNYKVFSRTQQPGRKDYFVCLALDVSGSTGGERLEHIKTMGMAVGSLLNRSGVKFAIYAHTGSRIKDDRSYNYGLDNVFAGDVFVVKDEHEPWNTAAKQRLANLNSSGCNLDGHALEFFRKRCDESRATDKVILYVTDGDMPEANRSDETAILKREIAECRKRNYGLVGIGMSTDSPRRHGLDTIQIDRPDDLALLVRELERRLSIKV